MIPKHLLQVAKEHRLIPFIGAGMSVPLGLPSWSSLIALVSEQLGMAPEIANLYGDFLQVAEYYHLSKGGIGDLRSRLDKLMNSDTIDIKSSPTHLLLPQLKAPALYTTNWDHWIEKAFDVANVPYNKIVTITDLLTAKADRPNIIKYHGDFSNDDSLVFRETSYFERLDFESPLDIRLRADILGRVVIFLGYSFNDVNVRYMWFRLTRMLQTARVSGPDPTAYIVLTHPNPLFEFTASRGRGIETIALDPLDISGSMKRLLEEIAKAAA